MQPTDEGRGASGPAPEERMRDAPEIAEAAAGDRLTRGRLLWMSTVVGLLMIGIAVLLHLVWRGQSLQSFFLGGAPPVTQVWAALAAALPAAAIVSGVTILWKPVEPARRLTRRIMNQVDPSVSDMAIVAATAGFCEELLFRGAVQPSLGVWWTSLVFMFAHGVILPLTWRRAVFGATIFSLSVGLGLLARHVGLASAMMAHAVYDFAVLVVLDQWRRRTTAASASDEPALTAPGGERG